MKIAKNNGAFIVPFRGSVAGVARDGKIMDFRKNEAIAYTECGKFSPLCSDGDRLFHADINGNVYDTLEHRAIGKLEERAWCLHPHNDDILAGTFKGVVSVRGNKTIDMPKERNGCVAQICTEGGRIFYLTLCDGAVYGSYHASKDYRF